MDRAEAEALGLIERGARIAERGTPDMDFNARLEASVTGLDADMVGLLSEAFGKAVSVAGDVVKWL